MKCKYKKFLKAAYINYEEDYCGCGSGTFTRPTITTPVIVIMGTTAIIACAISGVTIYYTLDGSTPTSNSTLYTGAITLTLSCTIKAIAVKLGMTDSEVASENYVHYLTAWRLIGNSTVHTDEYLTQWKVSGNSQIQQYLTQWKVEGNSVVDNPSANLPQGYKKCKYLEFHGTEYIDSGVLIKNDIGLSLDLSTTTQSKCIIGARNNSLYGVLMGYYSFSGASGNYKMYFSYGEKSNNYVVQTNVCDGLLHHIVLDSQQAKIDNENVVINRGNEFPQMPIFIGTWNNYNGTPDDRLFEGKIYSIRLYDSNGNLFNGIPCLDNNNVPCLYDTISNTAFYNDGTGTFGYELEQPTILSCGDLGQDGKYHVKISNGVDVFDIALTEPLRKVGDVADNIELINGVVTLTRKTSSIDLGSCTYYPNANGFYSDYVQNFALRPASGYSMDVLCAAYPNAERPWTAGCMGIPRSGSIWIGDTSYESATAIKNALTGVEMIYKLETPTTEVIQAPQISVSPTNTYSSANTTPYSAFTYANPLIYSCGDYSDVDGKYHVKISNGVTIYDIALTEPLRKVGDIADTVEFSNGTAVVTRNIAKADMSSLSWQASTYSSTGKYTYNVYTLQRVIKHATNNNTPGDILCTIYNTTTANGAYSVSREGISVDSVYGSIYLYDSNYDQEGDLNAFLEHIQGAEMVYALATPTTETIQVSPFPISPTDTYTSANVTPYSAFTFEKNMEIWSCGEYSAVDGKYHILVQPLGGSIVDIALDEPLRKWDNDYIDNIDYNNGVATLTRKVGKITVVPDNITLSAYGAYDVAPIPSDILYETTSYIRTKNNLYEDICNNDRGTSTNPPPRMYIGSAIHVRGTTIQQQGGSVDDYIQALKDFYNNGGTLDILYKLATPTTEIIQVPQIQEADSYSCVISQGGKAVEWSGFETE